jgi:molybdopterin/thiamine biosynthesis adenylyltransferase
LDIKTFPTGIGPENMDAFLAGVDVVVDGLDFFVWKTRRALFNRARALGIPVVTAGPIGFGVIGLVFTPDGMSFDDYFDIHDDTPDLEAILKFYVGIVPAMLHRTYAMPRHIPARRPGRALHQRRLDAPGRRGMHRSPARSPEAARVAPPPPPIGNLTFTANALRTGVCGGATGALCKGRKSRSWVGS